MSFEKAFAHTVAREGGYSNHKHDSGGKTMLGITEEVARAHGYRGPMRELPLDRAKAIYKKDYWDKPGLEGVDKLSATIAEEMFDTGVNMGPAKPNKFLQRALNALYGSADQWLKIDGGIGPRTLDMLSVALTNDNDCEDCLLLALNSLQGTRYIRTAIRNEKNETFIHGWISQRVEVDLSAYDGNEDRGPEEEYAVIPPRLQAMLNNAFQDFPNEKPLKWLQAILNAFNRQEGRWPDIEVDGDLGEKTKGALIHALLWPNSEELMLKAFICLHVSDRIEQCLRNAKKGIWDQSEMLEWFAHWV